MIQMNVRKCLFVHQNSVSMKSFRYMALSHSLFLSNFLSIYQSTPSSISRSFLSLLTLVYLYLSGLARMQAILAARPVCLIAFLCCKRGSGFDIRDVCAGREYNSHMRVVSKRKRTEGVESEDIAATLTRAQASVIRTSSESGSDSSRYEYTAFAVRTPRPPHL